MNEAEIKARIERYKKNTEKRLKLEPLTKVVPLQINAETNNADSVQHQRQEAE